jgi:hypothetical protein
MRETKIPQAAEGSRQQAERPVTDAAPDAAVTNIKDARRHRAEALLRDEELPDQDGEAHAWGDRPRGDAA